MVLEQVIFPYLLITDNFEYAEKAREIAQNFVLSSVQKNDRGVYSFLAEMPFSEVYSIIKGSDMIGNGFALFQVADKNHHLLGGDIFSITETIK